MLKKIWVDPVWSKVIAAGIVAVAAAVATYFAGWWPKVGRAVSRLGDLAVAVTPVPNWLLALFILCAIVVLAILLITGWAIAVPSKEGSSFRAYVEDEFFGIRWRWRYGNDGAIYSLVSFCPRCDYQIGPQNISGFRAIDHLEYRCDSQNGEDILLMSGKTGRIAAQSIWPPADILTHSGNYTDQDTQ